MLCVKPLIYAIERNVNQLKLATVFEMLEVITPIQRRFEELYEQLNKINFTRFNGLINANDVELLRNVFGRCRKQNVFKMVSQSIILAFKITRVSRQKQ